MQVMAVSRLAGAPNTVYHTYQRVYMDAMATSIAQVIGATVNDIGGSPGVVLQASSGASGVSIQARVSGVLDTVIDWFCRVDLTLWQGVLPYTDGGG